MTKAKENTTDKSLVIIEAYLKAVKENKTFPSLSEMYSRGITREKIRHHFSNITKLHEFIDEHHHEELKKCILTEQSIFTSKKMDELQNNLKKFNRFVITTIVSGKEVDQNFLSSIKNYCEANNATLLMLPCADIASRKKGSKWSFDPIVADENIVFHDIQINENLFLNSIKLSAKHINPLTGLSRIGQRNGSFIYASPKQALEYTATSPLKFKVPHALMTTGAITKAEYKTDRYMSERTSVLAENDHVMGAIIVEVENDQKFHFRQIQASPDGSFVDLARKYTSNSIEVVKANFVLGDWHSGATDPDVIESFRKLSKNIEIENLFIHDFFDGYCISHHDIGKPLASARKSMLGADSLEVEIQKGIQEINMLQKLVSNKLIMVKSNHDEVLNRYLSEGRYVKDPRNHFHALELAKQMLLNVDPLKYAYETMGVIDEPGRIIWLQRDEEYKIAGVECGQHGDLGSNGTRGSLMAAEKAYGNCVVGHSHSAAILRGVFRVGTSTFKKLDYSRGPSSWTHTGCFVYENGSRQLINFIGGKYTA